MIWHTQGAGKSLTMVFLVRKMRRIPRLRRFKVVAVTDRKDLEDQLSKTAVLTGETVQRAKSVKRLKKLLAEEGPGLVFGMVQKYRNPDRDKRGSIEPFPELNTSTDILVLVDEAHRSHTHELHANLLKALPNSARIGFTGTPIMVKDRKKTAEIFGAFIDTYKITESVADGVTVRILYEGRMTDAMIAGAETLDDLFDALFADYTDKQREALKAKYATPVAVLEAAELIEVKAADMLRHYVRTVLPDGFKAQVVAVSRRAAIRYQAALERARSALVREIEALDPALLRLADEELKERGELVETLVKGHAHLERIKALAFAAVISGDHNDDSDWKVWTERVKLDARVADFKKPFEHKDPNHRSSMAFLCVKSMLLTGFDAPVEQVMYLDRSMREHELLQAIARVNRTAPGKKHGLVVDYYGVTKYLEEALAVYSAEDVQGALTSIQDHLPTLRDRHARVPAIFLSRGVESIDDVESCVFLLRDERLRAEFAAKLRLFLASVDIVMPRPEALPYLRDARLLGYISQVARNQYRDAQLDLDGMGDKVRRLIDDSIRARGVDPKVPPVSILAPDFAEVIDRHTSTRAKALEMAHAARDYIDEQMDEDPIYYRKLSERLEAILERFEDNWDALYESLCTFTGEARQGPPQDDAGLVTKVEAPFFRVLADASGALGDEARLASLAGQTAEMLAHIRQEIYLVDFWRNAHAQEVLQKWLMVNFLGEYDLAAFDEQDAVADQIMELARRHHMRLIE